MSRYTVPAMRVHVVRLYEAIRKAAWRHGFFAPERIKHHVGEDGSHRISMELKSEEVEYTPPKPLLTGAALLGHGRGSKGDEKE
jgi:hypothetical protein